MRVCAVLVALSLYASPAVAQPAEAARRVASAASAMVLPPARFQALLQQFVDKLYGKAFKHLGDERDFDHGHLLLGADGKPVAILYHTQELAHYEKPSSDFAYIDPSGRNWIQWLDRAEIENADRYVRSSYPRSATWEWFQAQELPALKEHHTILDKMLDPALLGFTPSSSVQWVFTRASCPASGGDGLLRVSVRGEPVCLALTSS